MHNHSFTWLGTGTSIENGGVKLVLWAQTSPCSDSCNHESVFNMSVKYFKNTEGIALLPYLTMYKHSFFSSKNYPGTYTKVGLHVNFYSILGVSNNFKVSNIHNHCNSK